MIKGILALLSIKLSTFMSDIALYRKYRPQNFGNLVGQDHIRQTLLNAVKGGSISHAYLFCGPRGTGKTTTARLVAKTINCENLSDNGEPCEKCDLCIGATEGRLIDLIEIDAASNRGIDEIRALKEKIQFSPTHAKSKIYIIDEVHMLSKDAFNALLKTLEEPPEHVYFILATTESHKVPETIISRCQRFDFKRVDVKSIVARLGYIAQHEKVEAELDALELIARNVDGGLRDAIGLMEQITFEGKLTYEAVKKSLGITGHKAITQLYEYLVSEEIGKALSTISDIHFDGYDLSQFTRDFLEFLRERMLEAVKANDHAKIGRILEMIETFQEAYEDGRTSVIPQLPLEVAAIKVSNTQDMGSSQKSVASSSESKAEDAGSSQKSVASSSSKTSIAENTPIVSTPQEKADKVIDLSLESVKKDFPRIIENVTTPSVKRSFQTGSIMKVENGVITIGFSTNFHLEKVNNVQGHDVIERAFKKVFGKNIKLECELAKVNIEPSFNPSDSHEDPRTAKVVEAAITEVGWDEI